MTRPWTRRHTQQRAVLLRRGRLLQALGRSASAATSTAGAAPSDLLKLL